MITISKYVYIHKLVDIIGEWGNKWRSIKIKPMDVKTSAFVDFEVESNDKDLIFEVGDHARISKYKNIFTKEYSKVARKSFSD